MRRDQNRADIGRIMCRAHEGFIVRERPVTQNGRLQRALLHARPVRRVRGSDRDLSPGAEPGARDMNRESTGRGADRVGAPVWRNWQAVGCHYCRHRP